MQSYLLHNFTIFVKDGLMEIIYIIYIIHIIIIYIIIKIARICYTYSCNLLYETVCLILIIAIIFINSIIYIFYIARIICVYIAYACVIYNYKYFYFKIIIIHKYSCSMYKNDTYMFLRII